MRVVLNTRVDDAASAVCIHLLGRRLAERGVDAAVNDWDGYGRYHVAIFLGYDDDAGRPALEELGRRRPVELRAIYNVAALGKARLGIPDERLLTVRHVQWSPDLAPLADVDVGIVPAELPVRDRGAALEATAYPEPELA